MASADQNNISIEDEIMNDIVTNNDDNQTINISNLEYIYLIKLREFVKTNENIYKLGKSKKILNGTGLLYQHDCYNCNLVEKRIINIFKNNMFNSVSCNVSCTRRTW